METKHDLKAALIAKIEALRNLTAGELDCQISDIVDDLLSSRVAVTLTRTGYNMQLPICTDESDLVAANID